MDSVSNDESETGIISQKMEINVWGDIPEEQFYASQGVSSTKGFFNTPNGRIFTRSFLPVNREIKGIVCLNHGYSSHSGWMLQFTAIAFVQWGYAAFAADFPGHGRSDGLPCYISNMNKLTDSTLSYFKSVRNSKEFKGKPAFLYGESMGAAVALLMHLKDPEAWDGAILAAPMILNREGMEPSWLHYNAYRMLFGLADTWPIPSNGVKIESLLLYRDEERAKLDMLDPTPRYMGLGRVGSYRELLWIEDHIQKNMDKITLPFLTVHGSADNCTEPQGSQLLVDKAKSNDKTVKFYDGAYHVLPQGEPEETRMLVLGDIKAWLDQHVDNAFQQ